MYQLHNCALIYLSWADKFYSMLIKFFLLKKIFAINEEALLGCTINNTSKTICRGTLQIETKLSIASNSQNWNTASFGFQKCSPFFQCRLKKSRTTEARIKSSDYKLNFFMNRFITKKALITAFFYFSLKIIFDIICICW